MEKYANYNKRSSSLQLNFDQQAINTDVCSNASTHSNLFAGDNILKHCVMSSHFVNAAINDADSPPSPSFQIIPDCNFSRRDSNITPPLAVTTFSALNDSGSTSSSSSSEDEKPCTETIIENVIKDDKDIVADEEIFQARLSTSNICLLNNVSDSSISSLDAQQQSFTKSANSVALKDPSPPGLSSAQQSVATVVRPFSGLDDVLFNLADIPVESYSARQRSTINSEHHKEEARAQRQRDREAERQGSSAAAVAAALAVQNSMHAASGVGLHHVGHHATTASCHSSTGVHPSSNAPNQYPTHYGGSSAAPSLHHLQSHHPHNQTQQFHSHQQYSAHQHQTNLISPQLLQAQHTLPASIYSNYGHSQVASVPEFSTEYGASYSTTSSQIHHNVSQLPPPPPAHQQLQSQPITQQHSVSALPPLPHQPSHQQSMISLQQMHQQQPTAAHQLHQNRMTLQQVNQQSLTSQQANPSRMTQHHIHKPQSVKVLTPSPVPPPPSVSPTHSQAFQQGLSVAHNTSPLVGHQQNSAQTSPSSASNTSGGYCASSTSEHHIQGIVGSNGMVNYSCKVCSKVYNNRSSLRSHVKKHYPEEEKPFKCQQCTYSSHYRANLIKHMNANHGGEDCEQRSLLLCDMCHKSFHGEDEMREHLKLHNADGNVCHRCEQCNKSFKTKLCLKHHMDVHNPKKPFVCDMDSCDRAFRTAKYLKNHKDEFHQLQPKRFECPVDKCEMVFYKKTHLKRHKTVHSSDDVKSFRCTWDGCRKRFTSPDALRSHVAKHSAQGKAPSLMCELCDYTCHHTNSLNLHYRAVHNKSLEDYSESDMLATTASIADLSDQGVISSSDEEASSNDDYEEDDDSGGELAPPFLPPQQRSQESVDTFFKSETTTKLESGRTCTKGVILNLASATVSGAFSDSEADIKLDSQIDGIITNLEEDNNLMGLSFIQPFVCNKLSNNIDKIVTDIVARCDTDLPSTIGLSQFTEHEIFLIRESFLIANTPLSTTSASSLTSLLTAPVSVDKVGASSARKRQHSHHELPPPSQMSNSSLSPGKESCFLRHSPTVISTQSQLAMPPQHPVGGRFESLPCRLDLSDSPQPPSLEQQQPHSAPPPLIGHVINSSGGDIPDIISSVTSGSGGSGCKDTGLGDSPRKSDQRDLLDEVLEDIQQLQDKEMQSRKSSIESDKDCGNNSRCPQVNLIGQQQQRQQSVPKSLEKNVWNNDCLSSQQSGSCAGSKKQNSAVKQAVRTQADSNKSNLMVGLDAAATGSLASLFRPNMTTVAAAAAADLYSNYYRQQAQAYGMPPPSTAMPPPVAQAVAAAYDPYRSLSALGSKYMDGTAAYGVHSGHSVVPGWPPVSVSGRSPAVSMGYAVSSSASIVPNVASTGLCMAGSNMPGGTSGMPDSLHMTSALHPPPPHVGWPNPLATPGASSVPSDYMTVPGYSDYLGRAFDPNTARSSLEAYRGSAAASELYSQMVAASAGSYSQFYGQAAAARDGLAYAGVAANSRFVSDSPFQSKQPAPSYPESRSYMPVSAGYPYSALSASPYARVAGAANPYGQAATDYLGRVAGAAAFGSAAASAAGAYVATADPYRNTMLHNMGLNRYPF